jgi:hypothetical protein
VPVPDCFEKWNPASGFNWPYFMMFLEYVLVETFICNAKGEMWGHTYPEAALLVPGTGA